MTPANRLLARLRAPVIVAPLLLALGGCVAAPLMELATMPMGIPRAACGPDHPGCARDGMQPGGLGLAVALGKLLPPMEPAPCGPGPLDGPGVRCEGMPPHGMMHANPIPPPGLPEAATSSPDLPASAAVRAATPAASCSSAASDTGMSGCSPTGMSGITQGLVGSLQKFSPMGLFR
jgi:hypothetical protein